MHTLRTIMFTREEQSLFSDAQVLINVAFPRAEDPLTPPGQGVPDDDPRRRILSGLGNNRWEPVTRSRLVLAVDTLTALRDQVAAESDPSYWRSRVPARALSDVEESMATALTQERSRQARQVQEALDVATSALDRLVPDDDPREWAARHYDA